jgi:starvation-inducible DNA-binding protein
MYKKHHWQVSGPTFYQLHLLYDKHFKEQSDLVDALAERIQSLGGISIAMAHDEMTLITRVPRGREAVAVQMSRLLHAHEIILKEARAMARQAAEAGDDGTNDLLVSDVIRTNEMHVWFLGSMSSRGRCRGDGHPSPWWPQRDLADRLVCSRLASRVWPLPRR